MPDHVPDHRKGDDMFTPVETALGALLLHQGSSGLLQHNGRVLGISSLLSGSVAKPSRDNLPIIGGIVSSILPVYYLSPSLLPAYPPLKDTWEAALATLAVGFAVGWGTKNENGCTSGHMLCGLSRLSPRSTIATGIFFITALITANLRNVIPACASNQPCYFPTYPTSQELTFIVGAVVLGQFTNSVLVPHLLRNSKNSTTIYNFIAGLQFGLGLLISGLANPAKVLGFFSVFDWSRFDPSLGLVIPFAVGPNLIAYSRMRRECGNEKGKKPPTLAERFQLPTATVADIDWRFVAGGIAFGIGWGLCGVCPGPGLLRTILQPKWGLFWMGGYMLGSLLGL
ncbi:uncharacterized protein PADG_03068 [Paracoccidioides brasiliensis Pb18]|uniref:YeeE/YedE family integral membrane protein n=2 Tax=Paracoccidioides brasiliensis TaxID=121759 RepID=C1G7B3_PARBD|nr:uncharacterized protein PADG_03068 [Paracoccidioides brasiliensis Pb18]EEH46970.2 hypothetical protein PADG_03068 [Paracoccidioides brasiliensis Pb18]ODH31443.1 hypothetical protein ACO22_03456 [Paracoccidioides brasiliensis]ODH46073.1 hypothetical protein GX48_07844 [Paracoccidioides brasiliensis]